MLIYELLHARAGNIYPGTICVPASSQEEAVKLGAAHVGLQGQAYSYSIMEIRQALPGEVIVTYPR